jgi:hypothetical protein
MRELRRQDRGGSPGPAQVTTISAYWDARGERWAHHLFRQGVVSTAPWRRAGTPAPATPDPGGRPLIDAEFHETQQLLARLPSEDRILFTVWYTAADRREIPAWFGRPGARRPTCRHAWPWPRRTTVVRLVVDRCTCAGCPRDVPSYATLYRRLAAIHRALWRMLDERRHGPPPARQAPAVRLPGPEPRGRGSTVAHAAPVDAEPNCN